MAAGRGAQEAVAVVLAAVFLAVSYLGLGYACCAGIPFIAEKVAFATVDDADSPFDKEQLVEGALAAREYSFGAHDLAAFEEVLRSMNEQAQTPYAQELDILEAPVAYSVDHEQLAHLDDVNATASRLMMPILGCAAIAAFLLFAGLRMFGVRAVAAMLVSGGALALVALLGVGAWAAVSFDTFFAALHSLFFAEGTWTFPSDSLLITMLPEPFWAAMGCVWAAISGALSALSVALGAVLGRRAARKGPATGAAVLANDAG